MITRRTALLMPLVFLPAVARADVVKPRGSNQTELLQAAIDAAIQDSGVVQLGAGTFDVDGLTISGDVQLTGVPGRTVLRAAKRQGVLRVGAASQVTLQGLTFSSKGVSGDLVSAEKVGSLMIEGCTFAGGGSGLTLQGCGGQVRDNRFSYHQASGIHSNDGRMMKITGNTLTDIGNNAIQIFRSEIGEDGTIVSGNHVSRVAFEDGGNGQNGNGINVFRAGNVTVSNNRISDCAFTAIRNNSASNVIVTGNNISRCNEVGLYVEFAYQGAVVSNNILEDVAHGISIANLDHDGRLVVCEGNLIRRARGVNAQGEPLGLGILAEADTVVTGNLIEESQNAAIQLGWSPPSRNLSAIGNMVRNCGQGVIFAINAPGPFHVSQNTFIGTKRGVLIGMDHDTPKTKDLSVPGARLPEQLTFEGNVVA